VPTDALFAQQWGLHNTGQSHETADFGLGAGVDTTGTPDADVDAPEAWDALTVHASVTVAVIDTGVDIGHPDLAPNVVPGKDFVDGDAAPTPASGNIANSHGTHVAGIVAAESNDAVGMAGVCPDCRIMGLRIGNFDSLTLGREVKAINWAVNHGADVINLSLGSPIWSKSERNAIARAGKNGVLVVVAAGNVSSDNDIAFYASDASHAAPAMAPSYPASYTLTNILTVAASNDRDQYAYSSQCRSNLGNVPLWRCAFTSWGHDSVDVAAPGVDILSTVKEGQGPGSYADHDVWDGTSMASPLVAGIAGLVLSEHPAYSPNKAKNAIMNSANHPTMLKLYDSWADVVHVAKQALSGKFTRTQGRVNALRALTGSTANATRSTDGNIDGAASIASRRHGSVTWPADANDVFRKRLVKGNRYEVELNGPQGRDFDLWVWRPGTKEIFQFTSGCFTNGGACPALQTGSAGGTADERVVLRAGKTGVFFIHVNGWYSSGGYTLTIRQL